MLWLTAGPTHLAGRLNINMHPLAVLTAVSYRIGDDVAVGWRRFKFVQSRAGTKARACTQRETVI
jgi:hypothetical protein